MLQFEPKNAFANVNSESNGLKPQRKLKKLAMRISSLNSMSRRHLKDYLLLEKPVGRPWTHYNDSATQRPESRFPPPPNPQSPSPCAYSVKIPQNAIHGSKINPHSKYDRDLLPNPTTNLWTYNASTRAKRPDPFMYSIPNSFGKSSQLHKAAPAYSMLPRRVTSQAHQTSDRPSPNTYNSAKAKEHILTNYPSFSMTTRDSARRSVPTPGPAHYHPVHDLTLNQSPCFTFRQRTLKAQTL